MIRSAQRAIIYCRYSPRPTTKAGQKLVCTSDEDQEHECRTLCTSRTWEVVGVFSDPETSGADPIAKRPGLQNALAALRRGMVLVCYKGDRLARDTILEEVIRAEVARRGARVETVICPTDSTPEGTLIRKIMAAFAEYRRVSDAALTSKRSRLHQANGRKMSKILPYGFRDDTEPGRMIPCEEERAVIAKILKLASEGLGAQRIKRVLEGAGIPFRGRETWARKTITSILRREQQ